MKKLLNLTAYAALSLAFTACGGGDSYMKSPDGKLSVGINPDSLSLTVSYGNDEVVKIPSVGLLTSRGEGKMSLDSIGKETLLSESYAMLTGKRKNCSNEGVERVIYMSDSLGNPLRMRVRLYNDGVAFRYEMDSLKDVGLVDELTAYQIPEGTKRWIQKWSEGYEDFFPMAVTGESENRHWGYPVLVNPADSVWCLISEANIERRQSASSLRNDEVPSLYKVSPDKNELLLDGEWHTPWRVLIVGSLADVVESTLITDVSEPSVIDDTEWIKPGGVSWVYWAHNHGSKDYKIVKDYVDMGVEMSLPYVLIDAEWDEMGNGGDIDDMLKYIAGTDVKPLIWYNSTTGWLYGPGPKYRLNDPENREREFQWLNDNGVVGTKIDFFAGDTQPTMDYCMDLLESAAKHKLMVNFHGATIPRGWQRTYPNLMSVEGVYGAEWYNNAPVLTDRAAAHNATLPFTRNVIGSMDYTPVTFSDSQHPHITSNAHELALAVVFESGLQHFADRPESYLAQPKEIQNFLSNLPTAWDDTRLLGGYPGEYVVMARRKGNDWYIGGLNGTDSEKEIAIDWSRISEDLNKSDAMHVKSMLYEDVADGSAPWKISEIDGDLPASIVCQPRGGFVIHIN